jgi:dipeptidyl aminopeptidase/acylaminoacyl peptidase
MRKLALACLFFLGACAQVVPPPVVVTTEPTRTFTPSAVPSGTPVPTQTPIPTATPFLHPMAIETLRTGTYPGSDIVIEKELERGANYRRYYAWYLSEGLKIYALLTVPEGEVPAGGWPAIVFNHGYIPPDIYRTTERYIAYVDKLARSGYIVFRIDYRGHDQSQGEATGAYGNPGYLVDVLNAVASIKKLPQANPERIGMWGHSLGGFLTLRAMVISKDIKAGVIWAGVVGSYPDLVYNWRRTGAAVTPSPSSQGRGWRSQWITLYGSPEQNPAFWSAVSANSYLADLSGPLQLHHGTADEDVPVAFSQSLYEQVRSAGKYAELYTYPGDNHNISASFDLAMAQTIAFYDAYLK